jgi:argininosuccinate lyase
MLVRKHNVAFRTSHKIVGALVKQLIDSKQTLLDATPQMLQEIAGEVANVKLTIKNEDIVSCTNPRKLIETYKVLGGPSPAEVERAITARKKTMTQTKTNLAKLKENLENADKTLNLTVHDYSLSTTPKNVTLKNSN